MPSGARLGDDLGGALQIGDRLHVDAGKALGEFGRDPFDLDRRGSRQDHLAFRLGLRVKLDHRRIGLPRIGSSRHHEGGGQQCREAHPHRGATARKNGSKPLQQES